MLDFKPGCVKADQKVLQFYRQLQVATCTYTLLPSSPTAPVPAPFPAPSPAGGQADGSAEAGGDGGGGEPGPHVGRGGALKPNIV